MKVSIITATYNSEDTILDTIKSLESQTYADIEYIIVDGASTDSTIKIINNNCTRISQTICEPDKGIYDALNKGINVASGDIVGFLHSDDVFASKNIVESIVRKFESTGSNAIYGDLQYVAQKKLSKVVRYWKSGEYNRGRLKVGWMPPHPTFYMKREMYLKLGTFDLSFKIAADYDSLLRYLWVNEVSLSYLPNVITLMRVGGESNRSLSNIIIKTKEDMRALKKNKLSVFKAIIWKNISKIPQFIWK
jgi:glycosyltransferase